MKRRGKQNQWHGDIATWKKALRTFREVVVWWLEICTEKEDCNDRPNYQIQALFTASPVPVTSEELVKAVHFYEQLKRENPPTSGN